MAPDRRRAGRFFCLRAWLWSSGSGRASYGLVSCANLHKRPPVCAEASFDLLGLAMVRGPMNVAAALGVSVARSALRIAPPRFTLILACALTLPGALLAAAPPVAAAAPFVDVHAHPDPADVRRSIDAALGAMAGENAVRIVLMPPPFTGDASGRFDADDFLGAVNDGTGRLLMVGGGGTLNPMIQDSARSGDAGPQVQRRFRQRALELLQLGAAGFGELAAEHFQGATPYQYAPPDHPLFLLLADVAAEHGVPIYLHMEAVPQDMSVPAALRSPPNPAALHANSGAFERLLAHNRQVRIIWAHAGWDNTGYRTADLCRRLLGTHAN